MPSEPSNLSPRPRSFKRSTTELPMYTDSSRLWHYHVVCRGCTPKEVEATARAWEYTPIYIVATRAEAVVLRDDANEGIHGALTGHRHVLEGCASTDCQLTSSTPA